jgi:hypothetical protein
MLMMRKKTKERDIEIIKARNKVNKSLGYLSCHVSVTSKIFLINELLDYEVSRIMYYRAIRNERELLKDQSYLDAGENN